jgi:hypothetical protein
VARSPCFRAATSFERDVAPDERADHDDDDLLGTEAMPSPASQFASGQVRGELSAVTFPVGASDDSQDLGLDACLAALRRVVAMLAQTERRVQASERAIKRSEVALEHSYVQLGGLRRPIRSAAHRPANPLPSAGNIRTDDDVVSESDRPPNPV